MELTEDFVTNVVFSNEISEELLIHAGLIDNLEQTLAPAHA